LNDSPGFKKLQVVNAETRCTGVWLFNVVGTKALHDQYVAGTVEGPMTRSFSARSVRAVRSEAILPVNRRDARALRFGFSNRGMPVESGFLELYDPDQKLSVVALSDCVGDNLDDEQQVIARALASQTTGGR
jgi:hypothetical protein